MLKNVEIPQKVKNLEIFPTDGRTDRPTDRPTDQRVESPARD